MDGWTDRWIDEEMVIDNIEAPLRQNSGYLANT